MSLDEILLAFCLLAFDARLHAVAESLWMVAHIFRNLKHLHCFCV